MSAPLTTEDLDAYGDGDTDPRTMLRELVAAVADDRIADPADVAYALGLAAGAAALAGDDGRALELADRAVAASTTEGDRAQARGERAELLLRYGREEEGLAELRALRPRLTRDVLAEAYVIDPLVTTGRAELAEEWLTAAVGTAREIADRAEPGTEAAEEAGEVADALVLRRRDVRHELGLPPDDIDLLAEEIDDAPDLIFWPEAAHAVLVAEMPVAAEELGGTWDEHRARIEAELQASDPAVLPLVEVATPELLRAVRGDETVVPDAGPVLAWPPGRNDPCWCGSRTKYKKCCRPRARTD